MLRSATWKKAALCRDAGNLDEALTFYAKAGEQHSISGDTLNAGQSLLFCGQVHCANADWDTGRDCFLSGYLILSNNPPIRSGGARSLECLSRLYATHERWEEATQAMLGAAAWAEESGHPKDQTHFLCLAAKFLRNWKVKTGRENVARIVHKLFKEIPEEKTA